MRLRVDHVSLAVRSFERALAFFLEHFPAELGEPRQDGYDGDFRWGDFTIGGFKIELIESARAGSFVERFLARRGEGFHHLSLEIDALDPIVERLEAEGFRIVDRFDQGDGRKTAFVHPRSAFGTLIQFWQTPEMAAGEIPASGGTVVHRAGVAWRVDHTAIAAADPARAADFFTRHLGAAVEPRDDGGARLRLRDYAIELVEPASGAGEGLAQLTIDVDDLDATLAALTRTGVENQGQTPISGRRAVALDPASCFGLAIVLREATAEGR